MGAEYASMSGSGSSIFGIFKKLPSKEQINAILDINDFVYADKLDV